MEYKKKNRAACFLGLHFDFHAFENDVVGSIIDTSSIERLLDETQPDMIQVDTKGHAGISSYRTTAGHHAKQMNLDVLKLWRKLTAKRGIRLYAHHSGLYDQLQAALHPDWAIVSADGTVSQDFLSPFSPYVDTVLIPQLLEIAGDYGCNGAWIDGDCWACFTDYSVHAQNAWRAENNCPPPYPGDENYPQYREFCRQGFRQYVARYIEAVKTKYPDFEITSNWMYSHFMPEKRSVPIDYISGDYHCDDSVRSARENGRCCANQNITWDLMAWGQHCMPMAWQSRNRCTKEAAQLCQEAGVVLGLGGGFQFFNILYGTGGLVQTWAIDSWRQVAQFCRQREPFCFRAENIADIGIIYPKCYSDKPEQDALFTGSAWDSVRGWICAIGDIGYSCAVINEAELSDLSKYTVIVAPTADSYGKETLDRLIRFAKQGGTVIADGGIPLHEAASGVRFKDKKKQLLFLDGGDRLSAMETDYWPPICITAEPVIACYEQNYYYEPEKHISCVRNLLEQGQILSLCIDFGSAYKQNITYALKQYVRSLFQVCGYAPLVSVEGSDYVDVSIMKKNGSIMVNILNMAGEHNATGVRTFREIPPIGPLTVTIRSKKKPSCVIWQPDGIQLALRESDEGYCCTIDRLNIHGILEIQGI